MLRRLIGLTLTALLCAGVTQQAAAHPHVWVTVKSELVYAPDGTATAIRHHWTFDEMFSAFATQGMDAKKAGGLTRQDLAPLAEINVNSLKDFEFFTLVKVEGEPPRFGDPKDYWLDHTNGVLTLHFTLPFKQPLKVKRLDLEIYDATFFVDFKLNAKDPAALVGAPAQCKVAVQGAGAGAAAPQQQLSESFFQNRAPGSNFGQQFANRISVSCP